MRDGKDKIQSETGVGLVRYKHLSYHFTADESVPMDERNRA